MGDSLRVNRTDALRGAKNGTKRTQEGDEYLGRLAKLIPSEVLTVYLTGRAYAKGWIGWWAAACLGLVIVIRALNTVKAGTRNPQWMAVGIAAMSFIVWVYAMGDRLANLSLPDGKSGIASAAVLFWTALVPTLYKGDN